MDFNWQARYVPKEPIGELTDEERAQMQRQFEKHMRAIDEAIFSGAWPYNESARQRVDKWWNKRWPPKPMLIEVTARRVK